MKKSVAKKLAVKKLVVKSGVRAGRIESIWKQGNITGQDDWQKSTT